DIGCGQRHAWTSATELATATLEWLEDLKQDKIRPITSGTAVLDKLIGGFYPGELSIVAAKPGVGKTVFGMTLAIHAAQMGRRVGVMNLEMLDTQYGSRMVSNLGGIDAMKLRLGDIKDDEWPLIVQTVNKLSQLPAAYLFSTRYIEDLARAVREKGDIELLVVDYLQLVRTRQKLESERLRMAHISWALKELAVDLRIPVIAMSQLRRPEAGAADRMPTMRDLRESGNLEADADGIILLHEPASKDEKHVFQSHQARFLGWKQKGLRYICMNVEKQRQGASGAVSVLFEAKKMRYLDIEGLSE
ncbi:MAG: AAA family ATPase, partial [Clostridiales bacterium]|nr:AAA family ATPase [Clostridiales bacterium]